MFLETGEDEYMLACLLMVFVAVSIPRLARNEGSVYRASLEGHSNNIHCLAAAVNAIFGALFTIWGQGDIEDRLKEFLAVRSIQGTFKTYTHAYYSIYNYTNIPFTNSLRHQAY